MRKTFTILTLILTASCVSTTSFINKEPIKYDRYAEYKILDTKKGFDIEVYVSKYQFFLNRNKLLDLCKTYTNKIAEEHATKNNKKIKELNFESIQSSYSSNELTGIRNYNCYTKVEYKKS